MINKRKEKEPKTKKDGSQKNKKPQISNYMNLKMKNEGKWNL